MKKFRGVFLKNDSELEMMQEANAIVSSILDALAKAVEPGVETMLFEEIAQRMCREYQVRPAFQGYHGFPFALCCSVNEEVVHGFPSSRALTAGDIVSFDMGVVYEGFFGDSARTLPVGPVSDEAASLLNVTEQALDAGIRKAAPGNNLSDISRAVQKVAEGAGYSVVRRFVGHGIGRSLHEKPEIPNFVTPGAIDLPLKPGMVLAIEPMVTVGRPEVQVLSDNWTAVTKDGSLSAHFEHSVAVTRNGPRVLSQGQAAVSGRVE